MMREKYCCIYVEEFHGHHADALIVIMGKHEFKMH